MKKLKNNKERMDYLDNPKNWVEAEVENTFPFRVMFLERFPIAKIEGLYSDHYLGERWVTLGIYQLTIGNTTKHDTFLVSSLSAIECVLPLTLNQAIKVMREYASK